jgi:hypothetical protein
MSLVGLDLPEERRQPRNVDGWERRAGCTHRNEAACVKNAGLFGLVATARLSRTNGL